LLDDGYVCALAPDFELLDGGCAEGVGSAKHYFLAGFLELVGELADGGGFADSVYAYDHDDVGCSACIGEGELLFVF